MDLWSSVWAAVVDWYVDCIELEKRILSESDSLSLSLSLSLSPRSLRSPASRSWRLSRPVCVQEVSRNRG